jgi:protein SCO1/2
MKRIFLIGLFALLSACSQAPNQGQDQGGFVGTDITGADFANPLALTDHAGKKRTMSDFAGKVVVLFFGYTHCPDVCPTTMADMKNAMKLLGDKSDQVQVLFVTVDPQRDTQEVLAQFVPVFDKRFIGLWGSEQETAETLANFKVYSSKVPGQTEGVYTIDHSAGTYVFDKTGKVRLYMEYGQKPADIASDLSKLL